MDQASYAKVKRTIIEPMCALYRPPTGVGDPDVALEQYVEHLAGFDEESLRRGWADLVASYQYVRWPKIPEIRSAVMAYSQPPPAESKVTRHDRAPLARQLLAGSVGRIAAAEGWLSDLEDFALKHGRSPEPADVRKIKATLALNDRIVFDLRGGLQSQYVSTNNIPLLQVLVKLHAAMVKYEHKLCAKYYPDLAPQPPVKQPQPEVLAPPEPLTAF